MLQTLPSPKTKSKRTQVGRGIGSGHGGHTTGRGTKGQKSRSGYSRPRPGFEGGQMPLSRRLPTLRGKPGQGVTRRHFTAGTKRIVLKLSEVSQRVEGKKIDNETLLAAGLLSTTSKKLHVKILFDKPITEALTVEGVEVSKSAQAAIERAGGSVAK